MSFTNPDETFFATLIQETAELDAARLLIESKRAFGGKLAYSPFTVYSTIDTGNSLANYPEIRVENIETPELLRYCLFGSKVHACSLAEEAAREIKRTFIWIDPICLLLRPPFELLLQPPIKAAFRPVHIANIGQPADAPLNDYWKIIYRHTGNRISTFSLTSFVDNKTILPYFNTHCFSLDPAMEICSTWVRALKETIIDEELAQHLTSTPNRIFLFQAVLSGVILSKLTEDEIHILRADYSYPYHLQKDIPNEKKALRLEDLTCLVYEDKSPHPDDITDLQVGESLSAWLRAHIKK